MNQPKIEMKSKNDTARIQNLAIPARKKSLARHIEPSFLAAHLVIDSIYFPLLASRKIILK